MLPITSLLIAFLNAQQFLLDVGERVPAGFEWTTHLHVESHRFKFLWSVKCSSRSRSSWRVFNGSV